MTNTGHAHAITWQQRFKKARRKRVKAFGKKLTRGLANFLGHQSTVGDAPVLESKHFPFLKSFTGNWQQILFEAREILKHREAIPAFPGDISRPKKNLKRRQLAHIYSFWLWQQT